ncbi:TadE/TadG family type IV pilus assembly protein [Castellaniella hirudinis]|uniref:TadE/TadG family type IV pilus assembly protein n=1 Tax=Castellaniella hirudinis TaxID=1144617 RepID=UPI0039C4DD59
MNPKTPLNKPPRRLPGLRAEHGAAAIEAALVIPIMIFLMLGMVEMYQYFRMIAVVDRAAFSVANSLAMQKEFTLNQDMACTNPGDLCTYEKIMPTLMQPLAYRNGGLTVSFYTYDPDHDPANTWQPSWGANCPADSHCAKATAAPLPANAPLPIGRDQLMMAKTSAEYQPFSLSKNLWSVLNGNDTVTLSSFVFFRPRSAQAVPLIE